jgi:hypothetical protein
MAALAGSCGGKVEPTIPVDPILERHSNAGRTALALQQPDQAVKQYSEALARAQFRDDATAIGDLGFNLAVAQLRAGQPDMALATARAVSAELTRRTSKPPEALQLAEAIALYRLERPVEADTAAAHIENGADQDTAARATFLRGLIADDKGDTAGLHTAQERLAGAKGPESSADESELAARVALRNGDLRRARTEAEHAATMRRDLLDYRGLSRCLALAARAAEQLEDAAVAADLYLRAGRSAAAEGETARAQAWLSRALGLGRDPALAAAARAILASTIKHD